MKLFGRPDKDLIAQRERIDHQMRQQALQTAMEWAGKFKSMGATDDITLAAEHFYFFLKHGQA
jgi:hypothetical protein